MKPLDQLGNGLHMRPSVEGVSSVCSNCSAPLDKMAAIYCTKTLKNLLQKQVSFEAVSWYIASRTQGLSSVFK